MSNPKPKDAIDWTESAVRAFDDLKRATADAALLAHPYANAKISLMVEASNKVIGESVQQQVDRHRKPLAFFSKKLSPAQQNLSAYDRELFAAFESVKKFRFMLEGNAILFTDHEPLTFALRQKP